MLIISTPLKADQVKEVLDGYQKDGVTIRFLQKDGMRLRFEVTGVKGYDATDLAKSIIRSHEFGNALYFSAMWQD
ncbi:conserved hypothetical protein [uncultured Eubacteriales bacterium]|uniref:Uncharacterized protein n=1 Tax=uncultured Eubacteriales bacterium TaxID=172733 RepID=A0A212IZB2_9FIRM|nr:conserved hypothetical protein [uncultured Eubacteriales bacterium]